MRAVWPVAALVVLAACKQDVSPAERARQDERDIAQVEAAQKAKPPPQAITPEPISEGDIAANDLYGASCAVVLADATDRMPILITNSRRAVLKLEGRMVSLASDSGSAAFPLGSRAHYLGKRYSLNLEKAVGEGETIGDELTRWRGRVTVRDAWDQIVFRRDGALECGS
ncbi:MAG TPA: hypothetical protein VHG29_12130 [Novosphingobium sp.]|nr:hypothetical protein [Novosphingobium sp.]